MRIQESVSSYYYSILIMEHYFSLNCEDVNGECRETCRINALIHGEYLGKIEFNRSYEIQMYSKDETVTLIVNANDLKKYPKRCALTVVAVGPDALDIVDQVQR